IPNTATGSAPSSPRATLPIPTSCPIIGSTGPTAAIAGRRLIATTTIPTSSSQRGSRAGADTMPAAYDQPGPVRDTAGRAGRPSGYELGRCPVAGSRVVVKIRAVSPESASITRISRADPNTWVARVDSGAPVIQSTT